ncbi:MAG: FG-GAP repeat protein [Cyclobacteriaceae bacterium]
MKRFIFTTFVSFQTILGFGQFNLEQTFTDPVGIENSDFFGMSVDTDGMTAVVATRQDDGLGTDVGIAYVYEKTGNLWAKVATLVPSDPTIGLWFGHDIKIKGDVIAVTAPKNSDGRIYMYEKPTTGWSGTITETVQIKPEPGSSAGYYGSSIDLDGNYLLVGHPLSTGNVGKLFLYHSTGASWADQNYDTLSIVSSVGSSHWAFGESVVLAENASYIIASQTSQSRIFVYSVPTNIQSTILNATTANYLQFFQGSFGQSFATDMAYSDSTLIYFQYRNSGLPKTIAQYRLNSSGSFSDWALFQANIHTGSLGFSDDGKIIFSVYADDHRLQYFKKRGSTWAVASNEAITAPTVLPDVTGANATNGFYYGLGAIPNGGSSYTVFVGAGASTVNSMSDAGAVYVYDVDVSPKLFSSYPFDGERNITFDDDTTFVFTFDSHISALTGTLDVIDSATSVGVASYSLNSSLTVSGSSLSLTVPDGLLEENKTYELVFNGELADYHGFLYSSTSNPEKIKFSTGDKTPPLISGIEESTVDDKLVSTLTFNEPVDTVANVTFINILTNGDLSSITKLNSNTWQLQFDPDYTKGNPDELQYLTYQVVSGSFVDGAGNVLSEVSEVHSMPYTRVWYWDGSQWNRTFNKNAAFPQSMDTARIDGPLVLSGDNALTLGRLIIGENQIVNLHGESILNISGTAICEGSLYVRDSATVYFQQDFESGDSIFVKSGGVFYTYDGYNHSGLVHAERKNSFGLGKYSFVGTPFQENESITSDALGSHVYSFDPTQPYGTDGLAQWVEASSQVLIPGCGYTSSSSDTLQMRGTPNVGTVEVTNLKYDPTTSSDSAKLGWQLLSNPFLTPLNVDDMFLGNQHALDVEAIYLWDDGGSDQGQRTYSDYLVYNALGAVGGANGKSFNGKLMPFQAFMIKLKDSLSGGRNNSRIDRTFTFNENMRSATGGVSGNFFRVAEPTAIRLELYSDSKQLGETLIGFAHDASVNFDRKYDAYFRSSKPEGLFSNVKNKKLSIQGLPYSALSETLDVPVGITTETRTSAQLRLTKIQGLDDSYIYLKNTRSGSLTRLFTGEFVNLDLEEGFSDEYSIVFEPSKILHTATLAEGVSVWGSTDHLFISSNISGFHEVSIYDLSGKLQFQTPVQFISGNAKFEVGLKASQVYILTVGDQSTKFILK